MYKYIYLHEVARALLAGSPPQSTQTEVVLEVLDVNEHAPAFLVPNPLANSTHNIHLSRRTPVGRVLMKVRSFVEFSLGYYCAAQECTVLTMLQSKVRVGM